MSTLIFRRDKTKDVVYILLFLNKIGYIVGVNYSIYIVNKKTP